MTTLKQRKKCGEEAVCKYQSRTKADRYEAAVDAIADILLATAQSDDEATQILHGAEVEFRNSAEVEAFASEG